MIDFTSAIPIIAIATTSMIFKETRWLGVVSIAALSYFFPLLFVVAVGVAGAGYLFWRRGRR